MSKTQASMTTTRPRSLLRTNTITICAMLCALSVVLARFIIPMPNDFTRFSIESVPVFLAGMFFGPVAGALVGFAADFIGCLFTPFGYNPLFCLPPILYGVCGGLFGPWLKNRTSIFRLAVAFLAPVALGSILWQSFTLAAVYGKAETLFLSWVAFLRTRSIQFAVTYVLDVLIIYFLQKSGIFRAAKL